MNNIDQELENVLVETFARVLRVPKEKLAENHDLRLREDLNVNSKHYFPVLGVLSDDYDLDIDYHVFQFNATTIQSAIDFVISEYHRQNG